MLSFVLLILNFLIHPVHISVTNIEYFEQDNYFEVSVRVFIDDFEMILSHYYNEKLNLGKENESEKADEYIKKYVFSNLKLTVNDKEIKEKKYLFTSKKIEDITLWLNFKIKNKGSINKIEIKNSILTDLYKDQKNLLIFTYDTIQKAEEFTCDTISKTFNL